jgi:hypothetical protein
LRYSSLSAHEGSTLAACPRGDPGCAGSDGNEDQRNTREHSNIPWVNTIRKDVGQGPNRPNCKRKTYQNSAQ